MKKLFVLLIFLFVCTTAFPQWWVKGGNLIWPYGNVSIPEGNLSSFALRIGPSKITSDSLYWSNGLNSQLRFTSDGIEESVFYIKAYSFGEGTDAIISASAANGIDIESPWINIDAGSGGAVSIEDNLSVSETIHSENIVTYNDIDNYGTLHAHSNALVDSTITAHNVIQTSSLQFVIDVQIDDPFTAYSGAVHLNEIGVPVDTVIFDSDSAKLIICFNPGANVDIEDYDVSCLPVPVLYTNTSAALSQSQLGAFETLTYAPTGDKAISGTLYKTDGSGIITDFASGFFYLDFSLIPVSDPNATGYQVLSAP